MKQTFHADYLMEYWKVSGGVLFLWLQLGTYYVMFTEYNNISNTG